MHGEKGTEKEQCKVGKAFDWGVIYWIDVSEAEGKCNKLWEKIWLKK